MSSTPSGLPRPSGIQPTGTMVLERRTFVNAPVPVVWAALVDDRTGSEAYPPVQIGPAAPDWPAAGSIRRGRLRIGPLGVEAVVESLEARPRNRLHLRVVGSGIVADQRWALTAVAGGTRVVHEVRISSRGGAVRRLVPRPGEKGIQDRVEQHLAALKARAEATEVPDVPFAAPGSGLRR